MSDRLRGELRGGRDDGQRPQAGAPLAALGIHPCRAPFYASVEEILGRQSECFDLIDLPRRSNSEAVVSERLRAAAGGRRAVP
jgi:hypothetical protein